MTKKIKRSNFLLVLFYVFAFLFGLIIVFAVNELRGRMSEKKDGEMQALTIESTIARNVENGQGEVFSVLLLGHGGEGHSGGALADAWQLVYVMPSVKQVYLISIPRDVWVGTPTGENKINAAFAVGESMNERGNNARMAVAQVVGLTVDYFVAVDFGGFQKLIDEMGGVDVNVPIAFDDFFFPVPGRENELCGFSPEEMQALHEQYSGFELEKQFVCRYEQLHFDAGQVKMDGETALKFLRSRHSAQHGGDFARGVRQQAVLLGIKDKLLEIEAIQNYKEWLGIFSGIVNTDIDVSLVEPAVEMFFNFEEYQTKRVNLDDRLFSLSKSADGQSILIPKAGEKDFSEVHEFVRKEIGGSIN